VKNSWVILLLLARCTLVGQQPAAEVAKAGPVAVSGSFRHRTEIWDNFQGEGDYRYAYTGNIFRIGFGMAGKTLDWQVELAAPFLLGMPTRAMAPAPQLQLGLGGNYSGANDTVSNAGMVFVKQGWIRMKGLFGDGSQSLRIGRFEFNEGTETTPKNPSLAWVKRERISQRLVGVFGWSHVGRSFDGVHYVANKGGLNYTLVAAMPTRGAFQVDGWGNMKVGFGYFAVNGVHGKGKTAADWRAFAIYYQDWRHILKTDSRPQALRQRDLNNIKVATFGGHYVVATETGAGPVDLLLWGAMQTGKWGRLDHRGLAGTAEAGWQPKILPGLKPWIRGGAYHGSGDDDPSDGTHKAFFQMLPTPRPFARFPFFNMMNNDDWFGMLILRPHKTLNLRGEGHALRLARRRDLWYQGGGAFQPWTFGFIGRNTSGAWSLADLWDVSADWNPKAEWTLTGYFGYADGKAAMQAIYPKGPDGKLGYVELVYKF
jgi:hypothetical protein